MIPRAPLWGLVWAVGILLFIGVALVMAVVAIKTSWRRRHRARVERECIEIDEARREMLRQIAAGDYQRRQRGRERGGP